MIGKQQQSSKNKTKESTNLLMQTLCSRLGTFTGFQMNERVAVPVTTIAAVYNSRRQKKVAPTIPSSLVTAITHHHQTTISRHNNNSTGCFFAKIITTSAFASLPFCAHNNSSSTVRSIASSHHGNAYQQTQKETATNTIGVFFPNNEKVKVVMNKLVE